MSNDKTTPRPWGGEYGDVTATLKAFQIWNEDGKYPVMIGQFLSKEDGEFAVKAVNEYDALKDQIKSLLSISAENSSEQFKVTQRLAQENESLRELLNAVVEITGKNTSVSGKALHATISNRLQIMDALKAKPVDIGGSYCGNGPMMTGVRGREGSKSDIEDAERYYQQGRRNERKSNSK